MAGPLREDMSGHFHRLGRKCTTFKNIDLHEEYYICTPFAAYRHWKNGGDDPYQIVQVQPPSLQPLQCAQHVTADDGLHVGRPGFCLLLFRQHYCGQPLSSRTYHSSLPAPRMPAAILPGHQQEQVYFWQSFSGLSGPQIICPRLSSSAQPVAAILDFLRPLTANQLQCFLRTINISCWFLIVAARFLRPLTESPQGSPKLQEAVWRLAEMETAFQTAKQVATNASHLVHPLLQVEISLIVDASEDYIGVVPQQRLSPSSCLSLSIRRPYLIPVYSKLYVE